MKRILYSCFILLSLFLNQTLRAQQATFSISPNPQCYNTSGVYTATAAIVAPVTSATSYSWQVISASPGCTPTFTASTSGTLVSAPGASFDVISMTIPCCGNYTVVCNGWNGTNFIGSATTSSALSGGQTHGVIICPTGAGITPTSQAICIGNSATITASGASTYTWSNGTVASSIVVSPTVNTCYTYTGTTAQGCTVTPTGPSCVQVQAITATFSPVSQTMCAGSPVHFTAAATVLTGTNYAAGTTITNYQWFRPGSPTSFSSAATASDAATGGAYTSVITFTGAAGTCTVGGTSNVVISTSIPVTLTPANPSVCPNSNITLTSISIQTLTASNHTWTVYNGTTTTVSGLHNNPHTIAVVNPVYNVTVNVDYFGCPGTATTNIGLLTLAPTLTSSAMQTCPGQSLSLTASGGINYTFTSMPANPPGTTITIPNSPSTNNIVTDSPTTTQLPIQYCVKADSAGCTGISCIVVTTKTLTPTLTLTAPTASVCPGTEFTLTASGSGVYGGATYTFGANFNTNISNTNPFIYTPSGTNTVLPKTYTVTVDSAGCFGKATVTVYSLTLRTVLSASSASICPGQPLTLTSTGGAGTNYTFVASVPQFTTSSTSTVINAGTTNTVMHQPPSTITSVGSVISYTVKADSVGCKGSSTYTVGIRDLGPTLTLTTLPATGSVCPGSTVTINATGALNYTFVAPSTGSFATANATHITNTVSGTANIPNTIPLAGIIYTVQADSLSCVGSQTIAVHEFILHPTILITPTLVCRGMPVTITASNVVSNPITQNASVSYTFFVANTPLTPSVLASAPGSFSTTDNPTTQVIYSVLVDSAGCHGPLPTATINIRPNLTLLPSTTNASVCPGLATTLSVLAPTTALFYTYSWSQLSGTSTMTPPLNTKTVVAYPITNSTYSIHVVDSLGCVGDTIISVGIDPTISYSIGLASSGSTICAGQQVTLTATSTVAVNNNSLGNINYSWTPSAGITPTLGSPIIASPSVTTIYTVVSSNGYGCVAQNTIAVPVGQYPNPSIVPSAASVCVGFTSTLTAFGGNTYTWTGTTFTNAIAQQSISVPPGSYSVVASNGGGCIRDTFIVIGQLNNLTITATANGASSATTCITSNSPKFSKVVHLAASGAGTYVWFPYNPLFMTYSLGPQTDVRPPATTQYTVIGSTAICSGTTTVDVIVIPQFTINVVPPLPAMCLGDSVQLSVVNVGTGAVGPPSALTYSWTEALNAPPLSISDYFAPTVMVYPQNTTTYTTEVRDSRQCVSMPRLITVTVLPRPLTSVAIPTINGVATNTVCFVGLNPGAQDVTLNLTANNMNTGLQFGVVPTYTWISPYSPSSILSPPNSNAVTVNAPTRVLNGSSVVVYTVISGYNGVQGCKRIDTVSVRVVDCRPVRNVKFTTSEPLDTICARNCITFVSLTDTMAGGPQSYNWTFNGGSPATSTLSNPTVCYNFPSSNPQGYAVILQVSNPYPLIDPNGGPSGSSLSFGQNLIKVVDVPNVTIIAPGQQRSDTTVRFGQSVALHGSGAHTYAWSPAYNITSITKPSVTVNPFKTTQYILTGYNSKSCYSSDTINVIVVENCGEMYVPNAFTPNNDGANDVLYVRGICLQSLTFMVFDRWGEKVFETADQSVGWDGTYKGELLNTAVFVYRLEGKTYDGKAFSSKGNITLIR